MEPVKAVDFERTYDAPIQKVWEAWTKPEILKQWWGPDNVTIPECEVDLRVGGRLYIVMEAGKEMGEYAGIHWPMEATFTVIEEPNRLVYEARAWTEGAEDTTTIESYQELSLTEDNGKTTIHLKAAITKAGPQAGGAVEGMQYGYSQQLDKLSKFLAG